LLEPPLTVEYPPVAQFDLPNAVEYEPEAVFDEPHLSVEHVPAPKTTMPPAPPPVEQTVTTPVPPTGEMEIFVPATICVTPLPPLPEPGAVPKPKTLSAIFLYFNYCKFQYSQYNYLINILYSNLPKLVQLHR
jgi:hypothetical protein